MKAEKPAGAGAASGEAEGRISKQPALGRLCGGTNRASSPTGVEGGRTGDIEDPRFGLRKPREVAGSWNGDRRQAKRGAILGMRRASRQGVGGVLRAIDGHGSVTPTCPPAD